jgi:hypothetical protein
MPGHTPWVFVNGPVLPVSDRIFEIPQSHPIEKGLVFYGQPPDELKIGLRSGSGPAEVRVQSGGHTYVERLAPHAQSVVTVKLAGGRRAAGCGPDGADVHIVPLRLTSRPWLCWATILAEEAEVANFRMFGGQGLPPSQNLIALLSHSNLVGSLSRAAFLSRANDLLLPAGAYIAECDVRASEPGTVLRLHLVEPLRKDGRPASQSFTLPPGAQTLRYAFTKPFAPYEVSIQATCTAGRCEILRWRVRPDAERLFADLRGSASSGTPPDYLRRAITAQTNEIEVTGVRLDGRIDLTAFTFPQRLVPGAQFGFVFRFALRDYAIRKFEELAVFVHLDDARGQCRAAFDYPLALSAFGAEPRELIAGQVPPDLPPGAYTLSVGVYNSRTRLRLPIEPLPGAFPPVRRRAIALQSVAVATDSR